MASSRHIQHPGVEINEIDRSQYGIEDNTLPNAPVVLTYGFADKGENYALKWINSKQTLDAVYGQPTNEFEQYFYNSNIEILNRGGMCIAAKLPYVNVMLDNLNYVEYEADFSGLQDDSQYSEVERILTANDSNLTSFMHISCKSGGIASLSEYDDYLTKHGRILQNHFKIFDITNSQYEKFDGFEESFLSSSGDKRANDFLGIVPVIVTPANAMFFQNLLSALSHDWQDVSSNFNPLGSFTSLSNAGIDNSNMAQLFSEDDPQNMFSVVQLSASKAVDNDTDTLYYYASQPSLSRTASMAFPTINHDYTGHFAVDHLKHVGVVVFKAFKDTSNNNKLNFQLLESFVGSFDQNARDPVTKASTFIDDVINSQSQYINFFSNIDQKKFEKVSTICTSLQPAVSLGFYEIDCKKRIDFTTSIMDGLTRITDAASNSYTVPLDIIVDGGVSNIGWLANLVKARASASGTNNASSEDFLDATAKPRFSDYGFQLSVNNDKGWQMVIRQMNDFVKYTRKDCMFIADGLRAFALDGDVKIVRKSCPKNTVATSIIPNLTHMTNAFDSSYSAGYCNWYYQKDASSGDYIWIPPSIKAAGVYIYCDTYFQPWSAPAGLTRGRLRDVIDVAFTPNEDEAGRIYNAQWNYAMNYPMDGIVIEGHKTFQTARTALDRVNVRRLMLYLEKATARLARKFIYEQNTAYLRQRFVDELTPLFDDAMHREGIAEYAIKCDDELNTAQVIENNELRCRIAVRPVKTVDFLRVDFIITRQNAVVAEEVLR